MVSTGVALVFGLIGVALLLFVFEPIRPDVTALGVIVALAVLEPWTGVDAQTALAGFASPATVTILAMYMLSAGVQRTGIVDRLGAAVARYTRGDESRLLAAIIGLTGPIAGIINNTPVVAVFIPMVSELADDAGLSRSKLLLPLSYAAMLGGTLTLIGTATNLLASDLARELIGRPLSMFELTPVGVAVLLAGAAYLLTVGRWLTPARVPARELIGTLDAERYLARVAVPEDSPLVGRTVEAVEADTELDLDVLQVVRDGTVHAAPGSGLVIEAGDRLTLRASRQVVNRFADAHSLRQLPRESVTAEDIDRPEADAGIVEAVVPPDSGFVGETVAEANFESWFRATVLGVRRGEETLREGFDDLELDAGDTLLLRTGEDAVAFFQDSGELLVTSGPGAGPEPSALSPRAPLALGIVGAVVIVAALGWVPIVIAALGGVVAMVVTGCLDIADAYESVSWNVIFLLAGVLPLGVAMRATGGADLIAGVLVGAAAVLPAVVMLGAFYLVTAVLATLITPVASVVLMIPIAVETAARIGASEVAFLLAATFAGSSAFLTPIGYQTNLMVYGPGGYRFTDYLRVGGPLQALLTVVVTLGIAATYGVQP